MDRDTGGIPEDGAVPGVITIDGKPRDPLASAYGAGDFVYLEDREYKIASLERGQVELLDPRWLSRTGWTTRENFERLLKQDQRNGAITEFLPADLERFDQDLREVLASGLLKDRDKDYVSRWLRNGEATPSSPSVSPPSSRAGGDHGPCRRRGGGLPDDHHRHGSRDHLGR